jgi:hypothetical protein
LPYKNPNQDCLIILWSNAMSVIFNLNKTRVVGLLVVSGFIFPAAANSHEFTQPIPIQAATTHATSSVIVTGELPQPPVGTTDLKFRELFKFPIGSRGLEPSEKLIGLNGKPVRMVGYMAKEENPTAGLFILSPLPVNLGDEDESFADDLPANAVYVRMDSASNSIVPYLPGLIKLTGILQVGFEQEIDGRVSTVRLLLDAPLSKELQNKTSQHQFNHSSEVVIVEGIPK